MYAREDRFAALHLIFQKEKATLESELLKKMTAALEMSSASEALKRTVASDLAELKMKFQAMKDEISLPSLVEEHITA